MRGRAFVFGDEINTDYIAPGGMSTDGLVENLMRPIRGDFSSEIEPGDVIVAGEHFGSGSSRETAPMAIKEAEIAAVVAESFSRIFYRNSVNIGLPALIVPEITEMVDEGDEVEIDLEAGTVRNTTRGETAEFRPIPPELREIFDVGGIFEYYHGATGES